MKFRVIVSDPPWKFSDRLTMSDVKRGADAQYATMSSRDLAALPVEQIAADDCVLALWCPSSLLVDGLRILGAWGFTHKQVFTWVKTAKGESGLAFGMGRHFRGCTEHALIGIRGKPKPLDKSQRNVDLSPALPHSAKPETLQDRLDLMYEGPRLEMFARRTRKGWTTVGLECPGSEADIRGWLRWAIAQ